MNDDTDFLEDDHDAPQRRAFTQHDSISFNGIALSPLSFGTLDLLQETQNRFFTGSSKNAGVSDVIGFLLIHQADRQAARRARYMAWEGRVAWREFVNEYLTENGAIMADISKLTPIIQKMCQDFARIQTKSTDAPGPKKKAGRRVGQRG